MTEPGRLPPYRQRNVTLTMIVAGPDDSGDRATSITVDLGRWHAATRAERSHDACYAINAHARTVAGHAGCRRDQQYRDHVHGAMVAAYQRLLRLADGQDPGSDVGQGGEPGDPETCL